MNIKLQLHRWLNNIDEHGWTGPYPEFTDALVRNDKLNLKQ